MSALLMAIDAIALRKQKGMGGSIAGEEGETRSLASR